jgi:hypothetical protein
VTRMGRDAGLFVLAGGSVARPTCGRAIEPDCPRTLSEGRARPQRHSVHRPNDVNQGQAVLLHLAPRQANVYLVA